METTVQQIQSLRNEIAVHNSNMISGVCFIALLMVGSYVAAVITSRTGIYKLIMMLGVTMVFFIALENHLIHRAGEWIRLAERENAVTEKVQQENVKQIQKILSWESWLRSRKSRVTLLPTFGLFASTALLFVVISSAIALHQTDPIFMWTSCAAILIGIAGIQLAVILAGK